jgi:Na+/H+-dicarboxylate symporter
MGRTVTNVLGNAIACAAVAKWEGVLVDRADSRATIINMGFVAQ